jgi:hypothetical protein
MLRNRDELERKRDQRTQRTRDPLSDALISLPTKKRFDDVTARMTLDRAGVRRSAFHAHDRESRRLELDGRHIPPHHRTLAARGLPGSLFSRLSWSAQHGERRSPEKVDKLFPDPLWNGAR